jgi:hypothetical protein
MTRIYFGSHDTCVTEVLLESFLQLEFLGVDKRTSWDSKAFIDQAHEATTGYRCHTSAPLVNHVQFPLVFVVYIHKGVLIHSL